MKLIHKTIIYNVILSALFLLFANLFFTKNLVEVKFTSPIDLEQAKSLVKDLGLYDYTLVSKSSFQGYDLFVINGNVNLLRENGWLSYNNPLKRDSLIINERIVAEFGYNPINTNLITQFGEYSISGTSKGHYDLLLYTDSSLSMERVVEQVLMISTVNKQFEDANNHWLIQQIKLNGSNAYVLSTNILNTQIEKYFFASLVALILYYIVGLLNDIKIKYHHKHSSYNKSGQNREDFLLLKIFKIIHGEIILDSVVVISLFGFCLYLIKKLIINAEIPSLVVISLRDIIYSFQQTMKFMSGLIENGFTSLALFAFIVHFILIVALVQILLILSYLITNMFIK